MTDSSRRPVERPRVDLAPLYAILDVDLCRLRGLEPLRLLSDLVAGGARTLQIRQKSGGSGALLELCRAAVSSLAPDRGAVIVNDRPDIAAMADARGVHVGQHDLPVPAVRRLTGEARWVGISTHTKDQIDVAAALDVDYIAVGPVFRTGTKDTGYEPRGLDLVRYAAARGRPVVAIGGITVENMDSVLEAGAASVAVISDLLSGGDPSTRARMFLDRARR